MSKLQQLILTLIADKLDFSQMQEVRGGDGGGVSSHDDWEPPTLG
jgi:hypothetical protein